MKNPQTEKKDGTFITLVGGNNAKRIGGNSYVIEAQNEGKSSRVMVDLGAVITNFETGFESAFPDVGKYFDRINPETGNFEEAKEPIDAIAITHVHEDHVGALTHLAKMGYMLPTIYTSKLTRNFVRIMFNKSGLPEPDIRAVKPGENIKIGEDLVMEGFMEAHSTVDAMGFHFLSFKGDKADAGIVTHGDFFDGQETPFAEIDMWKSLEDIASRKPITHILLDSTMAPYASKEQEKAQEKPRLSYDEYVNNVVGVIKENPGKVVVAPVIGRSFNNAGIHFKAAEALNTKVCLDGDWLVEMNRAMLLSGHKEFENLIYKGGMDEYLKDDKVPVKYVVDTGAFAQGLQEYESLKESGALIPMASATKMALGLHPHLKVNSNVLLVMSQRIIDEINGKTGPKMLQLFAEQGATVVMNPSAQKVANFRVVPMQASGHITNSEMREYYHKISKISPSAEFISIHGSEEQLNNTKRVIGDEGGICHVFVNSDVIEVGKGVTAARDDLRQPQEWIGAERVYFNPLNPDKTIPLNGRLEYYKIDENFVRLSEKPVFVDMIFGNVSSKPGDKDYYANHPELSSKAEKSENIMINPYTGKPVKTKGGKFRKENPLKNKNKNKLFGNFGGGRGD